MTRTIVKPPPAMPPDRSGFLRLEQERQVYWEYFGGGDREVVVLFNGFATTTRFWHPSLSRLQPAFDVLLFDCFGQGQSSKPDEPYLLSTFAGHLTRVLDQLRIERVHGVGTSYGGYLGGAFGSIFPDRLATLTVSGIDITGALPWTAYLENTLRFCGGGEPEFALFPRFLFRSIWGRWYFDHIYGGVEAQFDAHCSNFYESNRDQRRCLFRILESLKDTRAGGFRHEQVTSPVLALIGDEDYVVPPSDQAATTRLFAHGRAVFLKDCGHAPSIEQPDRYWSWVKAFITAKSLDCADPADLTRSR